MRSAQSVQRFASTLSEIDGRRRVKFSQVIQSFGIRQPPKGPFNRQPHFFGGLRARPVSQTALVALIGHGGSPSFPHPNCGTTDWD